MKKVIKKMGNSVGIIFDREDCKIFNLKKDDVIELDEELLKNGKKIL